MFSKSGLPPPRAVVTHLSYCVGPIAPEGVVRGTIMERKEKKTKRLSPPQGTSVVRKKQWWGGAIYAAEIWFSCFCRRGNGAHGYEALFRRRDRLIQL